MASQISDPVKREKFEARLRRENRKKQTAADKAAEKRQQKKDEKDNLIASTKNVLFTRPGLLSKKLTEEQREKIRGHMLAKLDFAVPSMIPLDLSLDQIIDRHSSEVQLIVERARTSGMLKDNNIDRIRRQNILAKEGGASMVLLHFDYGRIKAMLNLQNSLPHFQFFTTIELRILNFHFNSIGQEKRPPKDVMVFWNRRLQEALEREAADRGEENNKCKFKN